MELTPLVRGSSPFLHTAARMVGNQGALLALSAIRSAIVLRLLGSSNFGLLALAIAAASLVYELQHMGLGASLSKRIAEARSKEEVGKVLVVAFLIRVAALVPLSLLLFWGVAPWAAGHYSQPELVSLIRLYGAFLLVSAPADLLVYTWTGLERFGTFSRLRLAHEAVLTVFVVALTWRDGVFGYFYGQIAAGVVQTALSGAFVLRLLGPRIALPSLPEIRTISASLWRWNVAVYGARLLSGAANHGLVLVASAFLALEAVGWLRFGLVTAALPAALLSPFVLINLPRMTRAANQDGRVDVAGFGTMMEHVALATVVVVIPFVAFAPEVSLVMGGASFLPAAFALQILLVFQGLKILGENVLSSVQVPLGRYRGYVLAYGAMAVVSLGLGGAAMSIAPSPEVAAACLLAGGLAFAGVAFAGARAEVAKLLSGGTAVVVVAVTALLMGVGHIDALWLRALAFVPVFGLTAAWWWVRHDRMKKPEAGSS